jgi:predicted amidophosphoribosyltransferase
MLDQDAVPRLSAHLVDLAGGYLRNAVRRPGATCAHCSAPVDGYEHCYSCKMAQSRADLADTIAMLTYAVAGQQSGYVLRGYKAAQPLQEHAAIVSLLILLALSVHAGCPAALADSPVTHWAAVPSLPARPGEHSLHKIIKASAPGQEIRLLAAERAWRPRAISPDHFRAGTSLADDSHVLLVDDTWATGGHAQSAALALKKAGASRVSLLVVARWLKPDFGDNERFLRKLKIPYDPAVCPWTGTECPPPLRPDRLGHIAAAETTGMCPGRELVPRGTG